MKLGMPILFEYDSIEENMATTGVAIAAARREQIARLNAFIENKLHIICDSP